MVIASKLTVLDPVEEPIVEPSVLAPRLDTLHGKVVGLYSNDKLNATKLLDMCEDLLHERFDLKGVVRGKYSSGRIMRRTEWEDVERCDAIILTHGD